MREIRTARTLGLKDGWSASPNPRTSPVLSGAEGPIHATFGPAGEASNESAEFDATAEWLAHVEAGRIGGS
jgi:hypothetical protein